AGRWACEVQASDEAACSSRPAFHVRAGLRPSGGGPGGHRLPETCVRSSQRHLLVPGCGHRVRPERRAPDSRRADRLDPGPQGRPARAPGRGRPPHPLGAVGRRHDRRRGPGGSRGSRGRTLAGRAGTAARHRL
ncbi:MAG: hypothetical protein AVDCRST_MAG10-779, partial [uncultured Acidimicrobiales bacterium]